MSRYNEWQKHYYKTGKALLDLFCNQCKELIYQQGVNIRTGIHNCDTILHKRSPGSQSDTWDLVTKEEINAEKKKKELSKENLRLNIKKELFDVVRFSSRDSVDIHAINVRISNVADRIIESVKTHDQDL